MSYSHTREAWSLAGTATLTSHLQPVDVNHETLNPIPESPNIYNVYHPCITKPLRFSHDSVTFSEESRTYLDTLVRHQAPSRGAVEDLGALVTPSGNTLTP